MLIYQVIDEQHHPMGEFSNLDFALQSAEMLMEWDTERYYYVDEVELNVA